MKTLQELKKVIETAIDTYGDDSLFVLCGDGDGPAIEIEVRPSIDSAKQGAPVVIDVISAIEPEQEW